MFDWENAIALDTMQGNRASSRREGKFHVFSQVAAGTWGIFSSYSWMINAMWHPGWEGGWGQHGYTYMYG